MRTRTVLTVFLLLIAFTSSTYSQMLYWTTPPKKFSMSPATPTSTTLPGAAAAYSVANGAYDQFGNLLFYVQDRNIISNTGAVVGELATYGAQICYQEYSALGSEIAIVPIPGTCKEFYVIYTMDDLGAGVSQVLYVKVNAATTSPTVTYGSNVFVSCPYFTGYKNQGFSVGPGGSDFTGIAVSKVYTGTGSSAKRFLYAVGFSDILRAEISNSGISAFSTVASSTTLGLASFTDFESWEAELSWGGNYFAWTSTGSNKAFVIQLNPANGAYIASSLQQYSFTTPIGLEFTNAATNPKLYVTHAGGLSQILTSNQTTSAVSTTGYDLSKSYLEMAKNLKIYGVSPVFSGSTLVGSNLVGVNISTNALSAVSAGIDSRFVIDYITAYDQFTLPDQIDGEDYSYFSGAVPVKVANFTINGAVPTAICDDGIYPNYCSNSPLQFNATYTGGTPSQYKIVIQAASGCSPLTGFAYLNYQGAWTNGTPPANLDLRTLSDGAGRNLGNTSGIAIITYYTLDACGYQSSFAHYVKMITPVPPVLSLEIYNKNNAQVYLPASTNIASPVQAGTASIGFRINNSTGTITNVQVVVDEVTNAGVFVKNVITRNSSVSGVSGLTYEALNTYCANSAAWGFNPGFGGCTGGYTGYFSYTNGQLSLNRYFKLTVTVSNQCNSSTGFSYLLVNSIGNKMAPGAITVESPVSTEINAYPNPSNGHLTIAFGLETDKSLSMELTDMLGRPVMQLLSKTALQAGDFEQQYDISHLPAGAYMLRVRGEGQQHAQMINKL